METLEQEITFYESKKDELENEHLGEWVLIKGESIVGFYDSFEKVAADAVQKFGAGPYLMRQIGVNSVALPTSVVFNI